MIALTRRYRFPAAHILSSDRFSAEENARIYGKCANPAGHGHDYAVEVTVAGPLEPRSGSILPRAQLDALVDARVVSRFGHRMLNDDPAFRTLVPTAENICTVIHDELAPPIAAAGARLVRVRVEETRRNAFTLGELR
ncbi:MAG TPA: 6-carboxytetrahydropterin synthase [Myxococcota bacterium]|nr:6-carboxytetrahydropterin synthase [Myxococcota bacterium]